MASRNATVSKKYRKQSHLEHIKTRPDTYIGSIQSRTDAMWVVDDGNMVYRSISYVPGLIKIFDEILVNAADNKQRDPGMKFIKVVVADDHVTVENDGAGIPVEMHAEHNVYVPQMVFGQLLSGDNYDDDEERVVGGRNGYGAKLTNIFSTSFCIETVDSKSGKKYSQAWSDNMAKVSKPKIYAAGKRKDFTRVTFRPDFGKFGLTGFTPDIRALLHKRVYDIAGTTPVDVRVYLNGVRLDIKNFKQYCGLYVDRPLVHEVINDRWEICVTMSPDQQPQQVSFCNSICTVKGGEHVKYITDAISKGFVQLKGFKDLSVKPFMVQRSMFIFVNALIINPSFDSQTKETLTTRSKDFGPLSFRPKISEQFLKRIIKKSGILEEVTFFAKAKSQRQLEKKTGGSKKNKLKGIPKLDDANFAGTRRSQECTLILTEGDSAKTLAVAGLSVIGRDKFGVFPLKGKLLNVRDASNAKVIGNAEIQNVMKIMGLNIGSQYASTDRLRYGSVMIMTDQDHDGSHIKGLIINFFHHFWPSLLEIPNFLQVFITPIVKCTRRNQTQVFYTTPEFDQWRQQQTEEWKIKYYKGLGTSSRKEALEYFSDLSKHRIPFETMQDGTVIDMCFSKQRIADRKKWIANYQQGTFVDFRVEQMKYDDFVNKEYIIMAVQSNLRAIPHAMDGLKPSQRKILFACLKRKLHSEIKVAQLAGYTSEHAAYHHGEMSLNGAIINMAQNFIGSNNINLLMPNGQFGTRLMGGKDHASPRYVFTQLAPLAELIYHPDDAPLYTPLEDDGQQIEPMHYLPVIPMLLVNGGSGIGTGWSTTIPSYNPLEIIEQLLQRMSEDTLLPQLQWSFRRMKPWYKDFTGTIEPIQGTTKFAVKGVYSWASANTIVITELPIGTWTNTYKEMLERCVEGHGAFKKGDIVSLQSNYTDTTVYFKVKMSSECAQKLRASGLVKAFKLQSTIDIGNMHAFGANGNMKKYSNELEILEEFYHHRLALYADRKKYQIGAHRQSIEKLQQKIKFIELVIDGQIQFKGKPKTQLVAELHSRQFTQIDFLLNMPMWNLTHEKITNLNYELETLQRLKQQLENTDIRTLWEHDLNQIASTLSNKEGSRPNKKRRIR